MKAQPPVPQQPIDPVRANEVTATGNAEELVLIFRKMVLQDVEGRFTSSLHTSAAVIMPWSVVAALHTTLSEVLKQRMEAAAPAQTPPEPRPALN